MYFILFSTFWLLFITSFIGKEVKDDAQAQYIYASVMIISVIFGLASLPLFGCFADKVGPAITIPTAFYIRFFALALFTQVRNPTHFYSYVCSVLMIIGTAFEQLVIKSLSFRLADREIRGVISGTMQAFGYLG